MSYIFRPRSPRRGQAALMITVSLPLMFGLLGMVVDVGWAYWRQEACKTAAQSAAEAAAVAAFKAANQTCGSGVVCTTGYTACPASPSKPAGTNLQSGCLYAQANGFTAGGNNGRQNVQYNANTTASPVAGSSPAYWVSFVVTEKLPAMFLSVLGQSWEVVSARSTAGVFASSGGGCIYVLDPTAPGALHMAGTSTISSGCGVYVNSSASGATGAINMTGSGGITTTGGSKTNVVGTVTMTGNYITPAAVTGVVAHSPADPFAATLPAAPAAGACQATAQFTGSTAHTIPQGTYCDEIKQTGSAVLTLTSGTYVLQAGIKVTGTATLTATGPVTLYVSGGGIDLEGSGGINLSPPVSGPYQGMSIWQPLSNSTAGTIVGSSTQVVSGLIYMPSAALTYTGSSATSAITSIVVDTLSLVGSSSINTAASTPWATGLGTSPGGAFLVE